LIFLQNKIYNNVYTRILIKKDHDIHDIWSPDPGLEHLQQCGRIKMGDGISTLPLLIICIYWEKEEKLFVNLMSSSDRDGHLVFQISIKQMSCMSWSFFYVQWVKMRGDCSICWYWQHCWQSLFKISLHKINLNLWQ
jgi:hypothetical protein